MTPVLDYQPPKHRDPRYTWAHFRPFAKAAAVALPLEVAAARLAYHTIGDIDSAMLLALVVLLNLAAFGLLFAGRRVGVASLLAAFLLIVPYQAHLGLRWWRVHREAERIRSWADAAIAANGTAPTSLNGYVFADPGVAPYISYGTAAQSGRQPYNLNYWVGTPTTSHWWQPGSGWLYYPD